jgi:hypothetical protein
MNGGHVHYERSRLYDAPLAFTHGEGFLLNARPQVLDLSSPPLSLALPGLKAVGPPALMREKAITPSQRDTPPTPVRVFNPSIAAAPTGLCPRCAFVVSLRAETLHQCSTSTSPFASSNRLDSTDWFRGTAIAVLDDQLQLLGWTWFLNSPSYQIAPLTTPVEAARRAGCVPVGSADAFDPPWTKQTFDARVLNIDGRFFVTYACSSCVFSLSPMRLTAEATADGGVTKLRAWATHRVTYEQPQNRWLGGRNQALFVYPTGVAENPRDKKTLLIQPRLGLVGSLGRPRFPPPRTRQRQADATRCDPRRGGVMAKSEMTWTNCKGPLTRSSQCGTSPEGSVLSHQTLRGVAADTVQMVHNQTQELRRMLHAAGTFGGLSLTSNLLYISRPEVKRGLCQGYLGIGHMHRGEGETNRRLYSRRKSGPAPWSQRAAAMRRKQPFAFGYRYTHFFYVLEPRPPFATVAVSPEFCIASHQDARDCESVQFVSGLALAPKPASSNLTRDALLLSYGVNDCEARLGRIPLDKVWSMLRALPAGSGRGAPRMRGLCEKANPSA